MRTAAIGAVLAAAAALTGCSGSSSPKAAGSAASAGVSTRPAAGAPSDCRVGSSSGAHDAAYAVALALAVDYREVAVLPGVVAPLMTPAFHTTFTRYLASQQKTIAAQRLAETVTSSVAAWSAGPCGAPVYRVAVVRQTSTAAMGTQTANLTVRASMTWSGTTYLLSALASS